MEYYQINSTFPVTNVNHQYIVTTGRKKKRVTEVKHLKVRSGTLTTCFSKSLVLFLNSVQELISPDTLSTVLPGRVQEDAPRRRILCVVLNLRYSSKAQFQLHMFTQDSISVTCRQIFKVLVLRHKKPLKSYS